MGGTRFRSIFQKYRGASPPVFVACFSSDLVLLSFIGSDSSSTVVIAHPCVFVVDRAFHVLGASFVRSCAIVRTSHEEPHGDWEKRLCIAYLAE